MPQLRQINVRCTIENNKKDVFSLLLKNHAISEAQDTPFFYRFVCPLRTVLMLEHYIEPKNDAVSRYDFVLHVYNRLKQRAAATELEPLKSRYSYMKKLLEQELG